MNHDTEGPGLLFSPAFWIGGGLSVLAWTALIFLGWLLSKVPM